MKVLSVQSRINMVKAWDSVVLGVELPEVHMHPEDFEAYTEWCKAGEFYRGIPYFRGSPVKMGERFKAVKGRVIFARGCMCADAYIDFVEEADHLEQINNSYISRQILEAFESYTPERKRRFIELLEKKTEELRKLLNRV